MSSENFYTYLWLREDGTPYYAGKGKARRAIRNGSPKDLSRILIQEFPSEADAFAAEMFLIAYYGRKDQGTGILRNRTDGGDGHANPSLETRAKLSAAGVGRVQSPATRAKMSAARKGKTKGRPWSAARRAALTPEARAKISAELKGRMQSPETRAKIGAARRVNVLRKVAEVR